MKAENSVVAREEEAMRGLGWKGSGLGCFGVMYSTQRLSKLRGEGVSSGESCARQEPFASQTLS